MFWMKWRRPSLLLNFTSLGYQCGLVSFQGRLDLSSSWLTVLSSSPVDWGWEGLWKKCSRNLSLWIKLKRSRASCSLLKFFWEGQKVRPSSRTDFSVSVRDHLERLTISDSVVFERVFGAGGCVVSLLVGILLEDMVPQAVCCVLQCQVTELWNDYVTQKWVAICWLVVWLVLKGIARSDVVRWYLWKLFLSWVHLSLEI